MRSLRRLTLFLAVAGLGLAQAAGAQAKPSGKSSAFDKMKTLVGEWEGMADDSGQKYHATTSYRLVADQSALLNDMGAGSPYEMVTMFHMDGSDLMATHYCGSHNQPRFKLTPASADNVLDFDFKDATNLPNPAKPHMVGVKITFVDPNHHIEEWKYLADGKITIGRFDFHRKM